MNILKLYKFIDKLNIIEVKSLDELGETDKWTKRFEGYDTEFSCLGARSNAPKVMFF